MQILIENGEEFVKDLTLVIGKIVMANENELSALILNETDISVLAFAIEALEQVLDAEMFVQV